MKTLTTKTYIKHFKNVLLMDSLRGHKLPRIEERGQKSVSVLIKHGLLDKEGLFKLKYPKRGPKREAIDWALNQF